MRRHAAAANRARIRIGNALYPIVASISASHCIVEVGAEPRVSIGDVATIFDFGEGSRPEDFGGACSTSVYDLTMHLNPPAAAKADVKISAVSDLLGSVLGVGT
ncbi:MAG TPA: hypothetical protein VFJ47_04880 [Terriglobales bacterium]|nr:hypothetical protein [Terriglobales bacterium]